MTVTQSADSEPIKHTEYLYAKLSDPRVQVRLLQLLHETDDEAFSCTAQIYDLNHLPKYHAISYTWGSKAEPVTIMVDGVSFLVNQNCREALLQAKHHGAQYAWIDSVCIDQSDLEEKSIQVSIMYEIYRHASKVLLCTGPTFAGIELLEQATGEILHFQILSAGREHPAFSKWAKHKDEVYMLVVGYAFNILSRRPYFSRLWVAQEILAAREDPVVACGRAFMAWGLLYRLGNTLRREFAWKYSTGLHVEEFIPSLYDLGHTPGQQKSFLGHLEWTSKLLCQDPRDRIYGTLSLFDWAAAGLVAPEPDYNISAVDLALGLAEKLPPSCYSQVENLVRALEIKQSDLKPYLSQALTEGCARSHIQVIPREIYVHTICVLSHNSLGHLICKFAANESWRQADGRATSISVARQKGGISETPDRSLAVDLYTQHGSLVGFVCTAATAGDIVVIAACGEVVLRRCATTHEYHVIGRAEILADLFTVHDFSGKIRMIDPNAVVLEMFATHVAMLSFFADRSDLSCYEHLALQVPGVGTIVRDTTVGGRRHLTDWVESLSHEPKARSGGGEVSTELPSHVEQE